MKSKMVFCTTILMFLAQAGCAPQPTPAAAGYVAYGMGATMDGKPLPTLVGIRAESCYDGCGRYALNFMATADIEPQAIDDEIGLSLEINNLNISQITMGKPLDVAENRNIRLIARPTAFLDPESLSALAAASGTITISSLQANEISGSASLTFTDPNDVNAVVSDSLVYEVTFSNLAVIHYCPGSSIRE